MTISRFYVPHLRKSQFVKLLLYIKSITQSDKSLFKYAYFFVSFEHNFCSSEAMRFDNWCDCSVNNVLLSSILNTLPIFASPPHSKYLQLLSKNRHDTLHTGQEWFRFVQKLFTTPFWSILPQKLHWKTEFIHMDCILCRKVEFKKSSYDFSSIFNCKAHITVKIEKYRYDKTQFFHKKSH